MVVVTAGETLSVLVGGAGGVGRTTVPGAAGFGGGSTPEHWLPVAARLEAPVELAVAAPPAVVVERD